MVTTGGGQDIILLFWKFVKKKKKKKKSSLYHPVPSFVNILLLINSCDKGKFFSE